MATIILDYDAQDANAKKTLDYILSMGFFKVKSQQAEEEESPYNPEFVAKIRRAEKQPSKKVDLSKYGIFI